MDLLSLLWVLQVFDPLTHMIALCANPAHTAFPPGKVWQQLLDDCGFPPTSMLAAIVEV